MKINDLIGQEVDVSIPNKDIKVKAILLDVDAGGILVEILSISMVGTKLNPFYFDEGDIVYLKDRGFHLKKTKAMERDVITSAGGEVVNQQFADIYGTGTKSNKGKKDVDIWFKYDNKIYYFEVKTNLDLDSEKSKATDSKVDAISSWMKSNYKDCDVVSGVLSCWYTKETGLPVKVKNVFYMSNLFKILDVQLSSDEYYSIMKDFGKMV